MPIDIDPLTGAPIIVPSIELTNEQKEKLQLEPKSEVELIHPSKSAIIDSLTEKQEILLKMGMIEEEFNGVSNIPVNHEYWDLLGRYRSILPNK